MFQNWLVNYPPNKKFAKIYSERVDINNKNEKNRKKEKTHKKHIYGTAKAKVTTIHTERK